MINIKGILNIEKISKYLPAVEKPTYKQTFNTKLKWAGIALFVYFVLSYVPIYGIVVSQQSEYLRTIQLLLGAKFGSLMTLGIGPIVTGGILMQLLVGSKIIDWDMTDDEDKKKFQSWNKLISILFCVLLSIVYVVSKAVPTSGGLAIDILVIIQLTMGGVLVILLDELVDKWGFGQGISLFIAAGVASQIFIQGISPFAPNPDPMLNPGPFTGRLLNFMQNVLVGASGNALLNFLPLIFTAVVFLVVVFMQNIEVEIPMAFANVRGFGRSWPLKLFYTSNLPVILTAALLSNFQLMAKMAAPGGCGILGCFDANGNPISGVVYFLTAPHNLLLSFIASGSIELSILLRAVSYLAFMGLACMLFSVMWVRTSGMDPDSVADQMDGMGLQIPGYRKDKKIMAAVLRRYIDPLALIGGLLVGLLGAFADFAGALGTGTGILLTTMIIYNYYEEFKREKLEEASPIVRKIIEG